jgi:HEAT repeat protein
MRKLLILSCLFWAILALSTCGCNCDANSKDIEEQSDMSWSEPVRSDPIDPASVLVDIDLEKGSEIVPELIKALNANNPVEVREAAAYALVQIGPDAEAAIPALINNLYERRVEVVDSASLALGFIGPDARAAVPKLLELLRNPGTSFGRPYSLALSKIGLTPEQGLSIVDMLMEDDSTPRMSAALALKGIGPDADILLPFLIEGLDDSHPSVRVFLCEAIPKLGKNGVDAIPKLSELAKSDPFLHPAGCYLVRIRAEEAIAMIEGTYVEDEIEKDNL